MRIEDHQEEAEPDDQSNSPDDQAAAEPDDQSNSPDDQAAGQRGDQGPLRQALHQQADAAYRYEVRRVVEQRDEESRESHHVQVRAERFGLRQLNQREQLVLQEQPARQEPG